MRAEPSTLLDAALAYLAAGRSIVPIAPGMKAPSIVRPTRGESSEIRWHVYKKRRPTVAELRNWFGADTLMGVGIPCGPVSGIERDGVIYGLETLDIDDESTLPIFSKRPTGRGCPNSFNGSRTSGARASADTSRISATCGKAISSWHGGTAPMPRASPGPSR